MSGYDYRAIYGKLYASLLKQYGLSNCQEIEDAIQNAFLKSLKSWKPGDTPSNPQNWLYIVARNDLLNQLKQNSKVFLKDKVCAGEEIKPSECDLRLETILLISSANKISKQAKTVFILKNIFGLHVKEISESMLLKEDAVYKTIHRARKKLHDEFGNQSITSLVEDVGRSEVQLVEEILYAVFNVGFDSFSEKIESIVNEDLCLEALSLSKLLYRKFGFSSTANLLALFCFHLARIPAKVDEGRLVSFMDQNRTLWDRRLIQLGFHYLNQPKEPTKVYIETLIISRHMTTKSYKSDHWCNIIELYALLMRFSNSPIIKLNYCYCLFKANRKEEAMELLNNVEKEFNTHYTYFDLVKAELLKEVDPEKSKSMIIEVLDGFNQDIRKDYLMENTFVKF